MTQHALLVSAGPVQGHVGLGCSLMLLQKILPLLIGAMQHMWTQQEMNETLFYFLTNFVCFLMITSMFSSGRAFLMEALSQQSF